MFFVGDVVIKKQWNGRQETMSIAEGNSAGDGEEYM